MLKNAKTRSLLFALLLALGLCVVLWTQSENLSAVRDLRLTAEQSASSRFHNAARIELRLRKLNSMLFRYSLGLLPRAKPDIESETKGLVDFFQAVAATSLTHAEQESFAVLEQKFRLYRNHAERIFTARLDDIQLREWRRIKEELLADLYELCGELKESEANALAKHLAHTRSKAAGLERSLFMASLLLVGVGALGAVLLYSGVISPLRASVERSKSAIQRHEKLSSLGMLAAGVAHEIRNPLTSIKARLFTQQALLEKDSEAWEDNVFIAEEITRLEGIVRQILAFARPAPPQLSKLLLSQPIREITELLGSELKKEQIELVQQFNSDPCVLADGQQIKQVLINLTRNAAESVGPKGRIVVRTYRQRREGASRAYGVLEVEDSGKGIPREVEARLFDPFFTTKPSGTGLGLSTAARIMAAHQGSIEYHRAATGGAVFRLLIPEANSNG